MQAERACNWALGETVATLAQGLTKKQRRELYGVLAEAANCTVARIGQLRDVYVAYTAEERQRCQDMTWALCRAIMQAAHRAGEPVAYVLSIARAENWHIPQATAYAQKPRKGGYRLKAVCDRCSHDITVRGPLKGLAIPCPVCLVTAWLDGDDGKNLGRLGTLC